MALSKKAEKIKKAYEELEYLSQDEEARAEFDEYLRLQLDEAMMKHYAEEQGMKQGIEQGTKIKQNEIAKKMLEMNVDINIIIEATGLTNEELEKLKD